MGQGRLGTSSRARSLCFVLATAALPVASAGCRVNEGDVKRWETTQRGPHKLVAVITHDKYPMELRTDAAMSLIRMPARGGTRQGIKFLIDKYKNEEGEEREGALNQLNQETKQQVVDRLVPLLIEELKPPPPPRTPEGRLPPDLTVPYKDAAFAMLIHEPAVISNEKTKADLKTALTKWAQTGFEDRIENGSQQYGLEQMMRTLGPESVKILPGLVSENTARIDRIAGLIKDIGDDHAKLDLSNALVKLAERYNSKDWVDGQTKIVKEYNAKNKKPGDAEVNDAQVSAQVDKIQERRLTEEIFPAMKRVAGKPSVDYLIKYAGDGTKPAARRKLALAALEGNVDKNSKDQLDHIFAIAKANDAPDEVRDGAFRRMDEFPKEQTVPKLYSLGDNPKWKVRWVAFDHILLTMTSKQIPDFMSHLPRSAAVKMGQTEPLGYAATIRERMEGDAKSKLDALAPYMNSKDLGPKLVALGWYWGGKKEDRKFVLPHEKDNDPLPKCEAADECHWECDVPKAPGSKETEPHEVKTVGDWVKVCLVPNMDK